MNRAEVRQIAGFLRDCQVALWEQGGREAMLLYLDWLYDVARRLALVAPLTSDRDLEFVVRTMGKKAQTLRRQVEERLGVRN